MAASGAPKGDEATADLAASYARCRAVHRRDGRTYYLATRLLPRWKRRHVHALYGFTRYADEIVDRPGQSPGDRAARLADWSARFQRGDQDDPLLPAVLHTIAVFALDRSDFTKFLRSMAMDLTVTSYATYHDLLDYMEGSAAVIGTMMLPILGSTDPVAAREPARQLGLAFQLTNFIRDVPEDLDRGRVYLPEEHLAAFGVTREDLSLRRSTPNIKTLIRYEVSKAREHYRAAAPGIPLLHAGSQACMRTAFRLYAGILDEIESAGYDVFARRAAVPRRRRMVVAASSMLTKPGTGIAVAP